MTTDMDESAGWTARGLVAVGMAGLGVVAAFVVLYAERSAAAQAQGVWGFVTETLIGHALGGAVAGWALVGLFGRRGAIGWGLALVGGALAALLAGLVGAVIASAPALIAGGSLVTEVIAIGGGLLVTPFAMATAIWFAPLWLAALAALHLLAKRARASG